MILHDSLSQIPKAARILKSADVGANKEVKLETDILSIRGEAESSHLQSNSDRKTNSRAVL